MMGKAPQGEPVILSPRKGGHGMDDILELVMVVCFGLSWPLNIYKAWKARTTKGFSVAFYYCIVLGYLCGIASKVIKLRSGIITPGYIWFFYILNTLMVSTGIVLYYRNRRLERRNEKTG